MGIPMLKIRRSRDRLVFNMGIPILVRRYLSVTKKPLEALLYNYNDIFQYDLQIYNRYPSISRMCVQEQAIQTILQYIK